MLDQIIEVNTGDGAMNTFVTQPDTEFDYPLVLLLMDAPGVRSELFDMAKRLGSAGYRVAVPNLYYRRTRSGVTGGDREAMYGHMHSLSAATVCADLEALLEELCPRPGLRVEKFGCVGYCMSGPFALAAASHFGPQMAAAASFHGVRLCHQGLDSVHRQLGSVRAELYIGCAAEDAWAPPELIDLLELHLQRAQIRHRVEWYPDTRHGFVFPERPLVYQRAGAERHWHRLLALFRNNLPKTPEVA